MNNGLQKLVDQGFMTEEQGMYIEDAVKQRSTIIVSGHKGWGILPLLATIGSMAKEYYQVRQVKGFECLGEPADYYIIANPKETDFEGLVIDALCVQGSDMLAVKDPDHPYSIMKVLKEVCKRTDNASKVCEVLECAKINDEKKLSKITRMVVSPDGKVQRIDQLRPQ
jgi:hypothetical protein